MITTLALIGAFCLGLFSGWALCGKKVRALEEQNTIYLRTLIHSVGDQWKRSKVSFTTPTIPDECAENPCPAHNHTEGTCDCYNMGLIKTKPPEPKQKPGNLGKATDEYKYGNRAFE